MISYCSCLNPTSKCECPAVALWSEDDRHAMSILDSTLRKIDGHYSVKLLWKSKETELANTCLLTKKGLKSLLKSFVITLTTSVIFCKVNDIPHHCTSKLIKLKVVNWSNLA